MPATRNPHHIRCLLLEKLAGVGCDVDVGQAEVILSAAFGLEAWQRLLDIWSSEAMPLDDRHLSFGAVMARRSRQLSALRNVGVGLADALDVVYSVHPTSDLPPGIIDPTLIDQSGWDVRDGFYARLLERDGLWRAEVGMGFIRSDERLLVESLIADSDWVGDRQHAVASACDMLRGLVEGARERFLEHRFYFRLAPHDLLETVAGRMDGVEVVSPGIIRAFVSGSSEMGCYVLDRATADQLPPFAIFERHEDGRAFLDADGVGMILPLVFPLHFTEAERKSSELRLAEEHPLTYAVLSGGLVDKSNFPALLMEWDDEYEMEDLPEFMLVRALDSTEDEVLVLCVRTDDVLARSAVAQGHMFAMPQAEFDADMPIDPSRHRRLGSPSVGIALVRPS
ncbi:hypothetical protein G6L37_01255 [Agrobacterium rubi]|nr:hypothetical protein [Agrobacterium rubi]NTF24019.1 hypothetical protein [Agrobacterium rubi]